ncbi:YesL family protein [Halalkalibacter lacteus]|uniref:YesL family protein n=1 Tax=Halalkalibacter lacteus TaxID=3090663 RepID=UPI002FCBFAD4
MQYTGMMIGGLYRVCEWVMRLAYVNLLWIGFTLVGFVVFGFFPSTAAMFAVVRKWVMGECDTPIFPTFYQAYKKEFLKMNLLGVSLVVVGYILFIDYQFFQAMQSYYLQLFSYVFLALLLVFGVIHLYVFPVYVHYDLKPFQVVKNALLVAIASPISTGVMLVGSVIVLWITILYFSVLFFFSGSALTFIVMWSAYRSFTKVENHLDNVILDQRNEKLVKVGGNNV